MLLSSIMFVVCLALLGWILIKNLKTFIYKDKMVLALLGCVAVYLIAQSIERGSSDPFSSGVLGALVIGIPLDLYYLFTKGKSIGFGDVKLGAVIGLLLGLEGAIYCVLAYALVILVFAASAFIPGMKKISGLRIPSGLIWMLAVLLSLLFVSVL